MSMDQLVPIWRFTERIVRSGLVIAWRLATSPTRTSPVLEKATTDGVVREPSAFGMTTGSPASRVETTELVVPRSMPTALAMCVPPWKQCPLGGKSGWLRDLWGGTRVSSASDTGILSAPVSTLLHPSLFQVAGPNSGGAGAA